MKTKKITISTGDILVVDVPSGVTELKIVVYPRSGNWLMDSKSKSLNAWKVSIPKGDWTLLGLFSDINENQSEKVCENGFYCMKYGYRNYLELDKYPFKTATASMYSLMQANGIGEFENPCILFKPNK